ncbi:MAG: cupredoxin domain-containing protein, partial [Chloroflexales bacterium]|nr:cupredoxin domain-containing protein [Chloroflexales bacterium]
PAAPATPDHQHTPAPPAAPAPLTASMQDFVFAPVEVRVKAGATIDWRNDGAKPHSATAVDGSFDTGLLDAGKAKELTFQQPGTFAFFCLLHGSNDGTSGMVGTLIVEP